MTPVPAFPAPPPDPLDAFSGHMSNWLTRQGYAVPKVRHHLHGTPPAAKYANHLLDDEYGNQAVQAPEGIVWSRRQSGPIRQLATRYGRRGPLRPNQVNALGTLLHESIHARSGAPDWASLSPAAQYWEEAAAEASTHDLLPALSAQLFGHRIAPRAFRQIQASAPLRGRVAALRRLSMLGSGAETPTAREARLWRREFAGADVGRREAMLAAARAARAQR